MNKISNEQLASLIEENMGLVVLLAQSFNPKDENELEEYIQLGRIGLWKAILKHDSKRSKLSTTMWLYVKWEILRYITKEKKHANVGQINESICGTHNPDTTWEYIPDCLSKKESNVIQMRLEGHTFSDIGERMGYSRGWANNTFKTAVEKINNANAEKKENLNV